MRGDEDGSWARDRAEARAARQEREAPERNFERESFRGFQGFGQDRERPDLLGLRLMGDAPSTAEKYGVTLMNSDMREAMRSWSRHESHEWSYGRHQEFAAQNESPPSAFPPSFWSCSAGAGLGAGPSVSVSPGPTDYGVSIPVGVVNIDISQKEGLSSFGVSKSVPGLEFIKVPGVGSLGEVSVAVNMTPGAWGKSTLSVQARLGGIGCKLSIDAVRVANTLEQVIKEAADETAPYAEQYIKQLGLPLP